MDMMHQLILCVRIIQSTGVEVIHLGHDRSVEDVVNTAIQEDVNAIAMTSYQGGHMSILSICMIYLKKKVGSISKFSEEVEV